MISRTLIFWPMLAQIYLTLMVYLLLGSRKKKAFIAGQVDLTRRNLYPDAWPESVIKVNNNLTSQFQAPVLFYALCFILWVNYGVNYVTLTFAWIFTLSRYLHFYFHTGKNFVPYRFRSFVLGIMGLFVLLGFCVQALI